MGGSSGKHVNSDNAYEFMSEEQIQIIVGELHPEILSHILLYISDLDLLKSCRLVCKSWKQIIDSKSFWKRKALTKGCRFPSKLTGLDLSPRTYQLISLKNPFGRNLIINPWGKDGFRGWQFEGSNYRSSPDYGFKIENPPAGADNLDTVDELKDAATSCFATTFYWCRKSQCIDLVKEGCSGELMDTLKPRIYISEWYAARFDCACIYAITVTLYNEDKVEVDNFKFEHHEPQWTGSRWSKLEHTFTNTASVRYVNFMHEGKDDQYWAGHYGSKMTGSTMKLICD